MSNAETKQKLVAWPALKRIGLTDEQLTLLPNQGFIAEEWRHGRAVYRLHFRDATCRQRAVNIRAADLPAVALELKELQWRRHLKRRLAELDRGRRQLARDRKVPLAPLVAERGLKFHGHAIRAPRTRLVNRVH